MAGLIEYNANLDVKGSVKIKDTPNQTGSVLLKAADNTVSTRTNAQFISDLNLALKNDSRFHEHSNKSVLDGITSTKVSNWDTAFGWGNHALVGYYKFVRTAANEDLNDITGNGSYGVSSSNYASITNKPINFQHTAIIKIFKASIYLTQEYNVTAGGNATGQIFRRTSANNGVSWTSWIELISTNNLDSQVTSLGFIKSSALPTNYITINTTQTELTGNKTSNGIWTLGQVRKAGQTDTQMLLAGGGHRPVSDFALASAMPTVNNGQLSLSTGTGLSGSATFTANQSGSSTFSVAVASTHKLPTTAEWASALTNTTYTAGTGLSLTGTTFSLPVTQSGSGNYVSSVVQTAEGITVTKATLPIPALVTSTTATGTTNVATTNTNTYLNIVSGGVATGSSTKVFGAGSITVASNTSGQLTITGTDTTYNDMSLTELITGTDTKGRVISAKTINDWFNSKNLNSGVFEKTTQGGLRVKDWNSTANYGGAIAVGLGASALRPNALGMMSGSTAYGINSLSIGVNGQAVGTRSISIGSYSTAFATDSHNFGLGLINRQMGLSIIGRYNDPVLRETVNEIKDDSLLFVIGNGKDSMLKSNSLEHYQDGSTKYFGRQYYNRDTRKEAWFDEDNTLVDVKYLKANGSGLTPTPDNLAYESASGDILSGQVSNAIKAGEYVYYKTGGTWDGTWRVVAGEEMVIVKRRATVHGIWLGNGNVLLRGYYKGYDTGTMNRGRVVHIKALTSPVLIAVTDPVLVEPDDFYLGTIIGVNGVIFFNPK